MNGPEDIKHSLVFLLLFIAAWKDIREKRIPNWLTETAFGVWLMLFRVGEKLFGKEVFVITKMHLIETAALILGLTFFVICSRHGLGFGDVKLLGAVSLYLGLDRTLACLFYGLLLAAGISLILIYIGRIRRKSGIPLAPFLLFGCLLTFFIY